MATTKITSQLLRFLHTLNRFKEVYLEENEIIGEPLFEGLPELRIRENSNGTYQIHIKGSDVSFILESLQHYFHELGFTGQIIYSSLTLSKSVVMESIFFSESEHLHFQEFIDYLEYDSGLDNVLDFQSEIISGMETIILFTSEKIRVNLPEEVLVTSEIKKLVSPTPWHDRGRVSNSTDELVGNDSSLTSTLNKLMSINPEIQAFAEYVLGTAWYELTPRSTDVIRFDPVVRKIPEVYVRHDYGEGLIHVVYPATSDKNKFITKILEFFNNSNYQIEQEEHRYLLLDNVGLIAIKIADTLLNNRLNALIEIIENRLREVFGESKKFMLKQYRIKAGRTRGTTEILSKEQQFGSHSRDEMSLGLGVGKPADMIGVAHPIADAYPEEYYEIDMSVLLNAINSSGMLETPLTLEELEVLLFINERKSKKVQSNVIMKKLGLTKEKSKELLKKLTDQGWFKVSHGWYSLRPSKAKLLEEIIEELKNVQFMSPEELDTSQKHELDKISTTHASADKNQRKAGLGELSREEMKTLMFREKMEKEFNEDLDEFYDEFGEANPFTQPFSSESDYDYEWGDDWNENLKKQKIKTTLPRLEVIDETPLEFEEMELNFEDSEKLEILGSDVELESNFNFKRKLKGKTDVLGAKVFEKPFMEDLSEEERLYLRKKHLESMRLEEAKRKRDVRSRKPFSKAVSREKQLSQTTTTLTKESPVKNQLQKISLHEHLKSLSIAGFTDEEIQVILALLNYKEEKMVFKSLVKHTTLKKTRLKKVVKELVKKGVIKRLRGDYVTIDYDSPNPNLKEVLKLKDRLNERKKSVWNIKLSSEELKVIEAMAKHKEFKAQSNSIANEVGLTKQKAKEILRRFAAAGICNVTRGWYALNEKVVRLVLGEEQWEKMKQQYQPPLQIPQPEIPLTEGEKMVYDAIRSQKSLKAQSNLIARKTGLNREEIRKILRNLVDKGILKVRHGWYCIILPEL